MEEMVSNKGKIVLDIKKDNNNKIVVSEMKRSFKETPFLVRAKRFDQNIIDTPGPGQYKENYTFGDNLADKHKNNNNFQNYSNNSRKLYSNVSTQKKFNNESNISMQSKISHKQTNPVNTNIKKPKYSKKTTFNKDFKAIVTPQNTKKDEKLNIKVDYYKLKSPNSIPTKEEVYGFYENPEDENKRNMVPMEDPLKFIKNNASPWSYDLYQMNSKAWNKKGGGDLWSKSQIPKTADNESRDNIRKKRILKTENELDYVSSQSKNTFILRENQLKRKALYKLSNDTNNRNRGISQDVKLKLRLENVGVIATNEAVNNNTISDFKISNVKNNTFKMNQLRKTFHKISENQIQKSKDDFDVIRARGMIKKMLDNMSNIFPGPGYYIDNIYQYSSFKSNKIIEENQCFGSKTNRFHSLNKIDADVGPGTYYKEGSFIRKENIKKLKKLRELQLQENIYNRVNDLNNANEELAFVNSSTKLMNKTTCNNNYMNTGQTVESNIIKSKMSKNFSNTEKKRENTINNINVEYLKAIKPIGSYNYDMNRIQNKNNFLSSMQVFIHPSNEELKKSPGPGNYNTTKNFFKKSFNCGKNYTFGTNEIRFEYDKKNNIDNKKQRDFEESNNKNLSGFDIVNEHKKHYDYNPFNTIRRSNSGLSGISQSKFMNKTVLYKKLNNTKQKYKKINSNNKGDSRLGSIVNKDLLNNPNVGEYDINKGFSIEDKLDKLYGKNNPKNYLGAQSRPFDSSARRFEVQNETVLGPGRYLRDKEIAMKNNVATFNSTEKRFYRSFVEPRGVRAVGPGNYERMSYFDWNKKSYNVLYM